MSRRAIFGAAIAIVIGCSGARATSPVSSPPAAPPTRVVAHDARPTLTPEALREHVRFLTSNELRGRGAGTAGEKAAGAYLERVLGEAHADVLARQVVPLKRDRESQNILGRIKGADPALAGEDVILGAHVDHLGEKNGAIYFGAEDNASGVALMLEIARAIDVRREELGRSVLFIGFGAEEVGLVGSTRFVKHPPASFAIAAMVNMDMIGRRIGDQESLAIPKVMFNLKPESVGMFGTKNRPALRAIVNAGCARANLQLIAQEDFPPPIADFIERESQGRGDNQPFEDAGIPTLFFGAGESDDYHKPTDTMEKLDYPLMAKRAKAILETVIGISREKSLTAVKLDGA